MNHHQTAAAPQIFSEYVILGRDLLNRFDLRLNGIERNP